MSLAGGWTIAGRRPRRGRPLYLVVFLFPLLVAAYFLVAGFELSGRVVDEATGRPLAGARIAGAGGSAESGPDGQFRLAPVRPGEALSLSADGYLPTEVRVGALPHLEAALPQRVSRLHVRDAETGEPVSADVLVAEAEVRADGDGVYLLAPLRSNAVVALSAPGFHPAELVHDGAASLEVALQPRYGGVVRDAASGQPMPNAVVSTGDAILETDDQGAFELEAGPPSDRLVVLAPGYRRADVTLEQNRQLDVALEPFVARGIYLTFLGVTDPHIRSHALHLLETTELNTLVLDVKGDRGWVAYPTEVALAEKVGATQVQTLPEVETFLRDLEDRGVYTIARIVVFKDDLLARHGSSAAGLDVAIKNSASGRVWIDGEGLGWVDPFREEVWQYNIDLAREAALKGFDEIQFDYIRFPTDPGTDDAVENAVYSREFNEHNRVEALVGFLERAHEELRRAGAFVSIDTFGYSSWADDDLGIGHNLRRLAPHVDYVSPMVYPSTYNAGLPGGLMYPRVVYEPYEVVYESLVQAQRRMAGSGAVLRPWLQYFDDYPWATGFAYNEPEIVAQKQAVDDTEAVGWMFWDPANLYERGGFAPDR